MEHIIEEMAVIGFSKELFEKERAKETIDRYQQQLHTFAQWLGGRVVTKEITVCYKQWLMERYSPASVNVALAALNGFFRFYELAGVPGTSGPGTAKELFRAAPGTDPSGILPASACCPPEGRSALISSAGNHLLHRDSCKRTAVHHGESSAKGAGRYLQ